jgi:short subunit dehydrogenase-like uncharacterized protein
MSGWLVYGATGYTGRLIAREAAQRGLKPILAGRNPAAVEALGKELGLETRVLLLDDPAKVADHLADVTLVLNCAGPFSATAEPMLQACLAARAHYLDITGEIAVFERVHALDKEARNAGVVLCAGVGFDVIPTDCVALMLKEQLPRAVELSLGFDTEMKMSRGTAKTMLENIADGGKIRQNGTIVPVGLGYRPRRIDFGGGERLAAAIPWGDVATAYYTTGIPNIVVYTGTTPGQMRQIGLLNAFRWLFRSRGVRRFFERQIEANVKGPSAEVRESGAAFVWGEAVDANGAKATIRIKTQSAYALTVTGALGVVQWLLDNPAPRGSTTPARLMGSRYVLDLPGTTLLPN